MQASQDLNVHVSQLRDWVEEFSDDPQQAFLAGAADLMALLVADNSISK